MLPTFSLRLPDTIITGQATIGKFDSTNGSLACGTTGGKIFIHNPHLDEDGLEKPQTNYLNINREITALTSGNVFPTPDRDYLVIGTASTLQVYDVERNRDIFFRDVAEGVSTIQIGPFGRYDHPLIMVGGNCSVQGYDHEGAEKYWSVAADKVSAMQLLDLKGDGLNEMVVGAQDAGLRIFRNEEIVADITESAPVTNLCSLATGTYGYALSNGTVGVYDKVTRKWRVKSKHTPTALVGFDMDGDGVAELVSGWDSGKVEVRNATTGETFFRTNLTRSIASLLVSDFRKGGNEQPELIVCGQNGEVRGFATASDQTQVAQMTTEKAVNDLNKKKQELLYELSSIETNLRTAETSGTIWDAGSREQGQADVGETLPPNTVVQVTQAVNRPNGSLDFIYSVNNGCCVKGVILSGEGLFDGTDSLLHQPPIPTASVVVPLVPARNVITEEITSRVLVAKSFSSPIVQAYELKTVLPRFCMFTIARDGVYGNYVHPSSYCRMLVRERVSKFGAWMASRFQVEIEGLEEAETLEATFQSIRDHTVFIASMNKSQQQPGKYDVVIHCDDMDFAGELIQDVCEFMGIDEGNSHALYPMEFDALRTVLQSVEDANGMRVKMQSESADATGLVKALVVKAEDARLLRDVNNMRRAYTSLLDINRDLLLEQTKRVTNHEQLLEALKKVNAVIQKAAKLRRGKAKTEVVAASRAAIKTQNFAQLLRILEYGAQGQYM